MSDFLSKMTELSVARAVALHDTSGAAAIMEQASSASPPLPLDVTGPGFDVIAEAKLASPSAGRLAPDGTDVVVDLARRYEASGAAAISVLTEESSFAGSLEHLRAVASGTTVPVMRKDFLVDPIQVVEARAAGASGVLLIARLLPGELLVEMTDQAEALGMFVLVEVFDRSDLETAVAVFGRDVLVGVNCRDLSSLEVDPGRFAALAPHLPDHLPAVAESGIETAEDVSAVASLGYRLALVGTSLVTSTDPESALSTLLETGRTAAGSR